MSEFKVIETQEELDAVLQKRLERKEREVQEKYKGFTSPDDVEKIKADYEAKIKAKDEEMKKAAEKYAENDKVVSDLTLRAENAEKSLLRAEVASEHKLPYELASRLLGETKEDMQKDAELLASYMKPQSAPPAYTSTPAGNAAAHGNHDAAYMALLDGITGQSIGG